MRSLAAVVFLVLAALTPAAAQFVGPSAQGRVATVSDVQNARLGTYVTVTGNIVDHQRRDFFTFRDATGDIRVEIDPGVWQGREVLPATTVRLLGEVDRGWAGRYLWVKSLEILK